MRFLSFFGLPSRPSPRPLAGVLAVAALFVVGTACDAIDASEEATVASTPDEAITLDALIASTTSALDLSSAQSGHMEEVERRFRGQPPEPGALWTAAAEMHPSLTSEQIDSLEARLRTRAQRLADRRGNFPENGPGFGAGGPPNGPGMGGPGMRGPGMGGPQGGGPNGPGGPWAELDLADEQVEALREIRDTYRQQYQDLIAQYEEQEVSETEAATAYTELATALREEVHDVLTEEQRTQVEERLENQNDRREALQAARNDALALSALQADGFDAMLQLENGPRRPSGFVGNFDVWLIGREALLTDVQTEIAIVHASLVAEHMHRKMQLRRGQGPGGMGPGGPGGGLGG